MDSRMGAPYRSTSQRRAPFLFGCLGALAMATLSVCLWLGLSVMPVFSGSVPAPPPPDSAREDVTILVPESFIQRALVEALPESASDVAAFDIQPGNRLVLHANVDLLVTDISVEAALGLRVEGGQLRVTIDSLQAGEQELADLFSGSLESLTAEIAETIQGQLETALGPGARLLTVETTDQQLIFKARWDSVEQ